MGVPIRDIHGSRENFLVETECKNAAQRLTVRLSSLWVPSYVRVGHFLEVNFDPPFFSPVGSEYRAPSPSHAVYWAATRVSSPRAPRYQVCGCCPKRMHIGGEICARFAGERHPPFLLGHSPLLAFLVLFQKGKFSLDCGWIPLKI